MKIVNIEKIGKKKVFDITVADNHQYVLANGVVTHNTGQEYSSDEIFIITRSQDKSKDEGESVLDGFTFTINIEKSRSVIEKSKFPFSVAFGRDGQRAGIQKWSGLLELAQDTGHVIKPKSGWYSRPCVPDDKSWREKETMNSTFWNPILATDFPAKLTDMFKMKETAMLTNDE